MQGMKFIYMYTVISTYDLINTYKFCFCIFVREVAFNLVFRRSPWVYVYDRGVSGASERGGVVRHLRGDETE